MSALKRIAAGPLVLLLLILGACRSLPVQELASTIQPSTAAATATAPLPATTVAPSPSATPVPTALPLANPTVPGATPLPTATATATPTPAPTVSFAVIGDYGQAGQPEADVAALVSSWNPDFIITVGDNNYPIGAAATIDDNIGQYYAPYLQPYDGAYPVKPGNRHNRFFPTLGNHDYLSEDAAPYFDYFTLPGNERYYDVGWEPVHLFALNSNWQEPDGIRADSAQAAWLRNRLAEVTAPWKIVFMHVPPFSSGHHGSSPVFQWPFAAWGATAVITGHDHLYERLLVDGIPYFVNGLGGYPAIYAFGEPLPESQFRFRGDYGAMRVTATPEQILFEFVDRTGTIIDSYAMTAPE